MVRRQITELTILPASLEEVVEAIGEAATIKLVESFGGTTKRLPAKRNCVAGNELAKVIGVEALRQLVNKLGGARYVYLPRCVDGLRKQRDQQIVERSKTEPVEKLARDYNLSDRQIWTILKKTEMDDGQESLF
jgi:hypothetical protein